ncbi:MAG: hypothetical protein WC100_21450, partial [Sterolibacterium sp.]
MSSADAPNADIRRQPRDDGEGLHWPITMRRVSAKLAEEKSVSAGRRDQGPMQPRSLSLKEQVVAWMCPG